VPRLRPIAFTIGVLALSSSSSARAEDELLRGPHPFLHDNELTLHAGYSAALGDGARGLHVQGDYTYRLGQLLWLDLQMALTNGSCNVNEKACAKGSGSAIDIVGGVAWKFQTNVPVVPYVRLAGGPIFLFPDGTRSRFGLLGRGGIGAHYYFVDWFGLGVEFTGSGGFAFYGGSSLRMLGSFDASVGAAFQF
jgi:hypothetical protein